MCKPSPEKPLSGIDMKTIVAEEKEKRTGRAQQIESEWAGSQDINNLMAHGESWGLFVWKMRSSQRISSENWSDSTDVPGGLLAVMWIINSRVKEQLGNIIN